MAILAGLIIGAIEFFALGAIAAIWMSSIYGSNSGGTEMSSFFTFGPLGGLSGLLLGIGLVLHFRGKRKGLAKGLMLTAASLTGLGAVALIALALSH